jgi:multiple sugar transport system substrate-binding protein
MNHKFKNLKRFTAALVMSSLLLSLAVGCGEKDETRGREGQNERHQGVIDRAGELKSHASLPDITVDRKVRLLSWYDVDESSPTAELFREKYGVPQAEVNDRILDITRVSYVDRYTRLNSMIASGDSPDMFQFEERNFPWGVLANSYEPVCDLIDFSDPIWDHTRDIMELFRWQGKDYCAITELAPSSALLYYRKSVVAEAGLEDPYDLWLRNSWNWGTFLDMMKKFSDPVNNKYGIIGFYIDEAAILSTGTGIITIENGLLKDNMNDVRIERAMDLLLNLAQNNYRYPYHEISEYAILPAPFRNQEVLFWNDGPWRYQEEIKTMRDADKWPEDELRIVPFPADPTALANGTFYHRGKQDSLMLVAGSKNKEGFKAWTLCAAVAAQDERMEALNREKIMEDYGWTEMQLGVLDRIEETSTLIWDFKNGIGNDVADATSASPVENLSKPVIVDGLTYTQQRGRNSNIIRVRVEDINAGRNIDDMEKYEKPDCDCDPNAEEPEFCEVCEEE